MTQKIRSEKDIDIIIGWIFGNNCGGDYFCDVADYCLDKVKCISNFVRKKVAKEYLLTDDNIFTILDDIYKNTYQFKSKDKFYDDEFHKDDFIIWEDEYGIIVTSAEKMEILNKHLK